MGLVVWLRCQRSFVIPETNVPVGPKREEVWHGASGTTSNDEQPEGEWGLEVESEGCQEAEERHGHELGNEPDEEADWTTKLI